MPIRGKPQISACHCEGAQRPRQSALCKPLPLGEVPPEGAERALSVSFADSSPIGGAMGERIATVACVIVRLPPAIVHLDPLRYAPRNDILKYGAASQ